MPPPAPAPGARPAPARRHPSAVLAYATSVGAVGTAAMVAVLLLAPPWDGLAAHPVQLAALALALVVGEVTPVPVSRGDSTISTVTISTTFAVALLVLGPMSLLLLVHTVAVGLDDLRSGRRPVQVLFNCGQYALSLLAARAVFSALSGEPLLGATDAFTAGLLLPALAAGVVFAVVNDGLVSVIAALATGQRPWAVVVDDLRFKLETSGVLVALGPVAAALVATSVLLLPLLVLPILAVRRTALVAALREHQSLHDPLTGLANRHLFRRRVERALEGRHGGHGRGVAVLMLDLDHFKDVNDTLGHHVGDQLLVEVAARIAHASDEHDAEAVVARLGGDEFAVLLAADQPERVATALAEQLLAGFARPVDVHGTRLSVGVSIGITSTDGSRLDDVHSALKQADIALYEAKQERARASVYTPRATPTGTERVHLLPQLQEAVETGQLRVVYQPQVDAASGRVAAVEALVRWEHPQLGRLGPAAFVDLAESSGLIAPITTFVLEEALAAAVHWRGLGADVGVAVNVSARQLSDLNLPGTVAALLHRAGLPPSRLTVEVTENSLMSDVRAARTILGALRDTGVQLAIDDFGTGYSSLRLLQQLDVDELKVDRSFVTGLGAVGNDEILVRSIIELGHNLGLRVVGEGVETAEVADRLRGMDCDRLQGYLFGRPMERDAVDALLAGPALAGPVLAEPVLAGPAPAGRLRAAAPPPASAVPLVPAPGAPPA